MLSVIFSSAKSGFFFFDLLCMRLPPAEGSNTSITVSHKLSAGIPSYLRPAPNETISDSVLLRETFVCFLQDQLIGTNALLHQSAQHVR